MVSGESGDDDSPEDLMASGRKLPLGMMVFVCRHLPDKQKSIQLCELCVAVMKQHLRFLCALCASVVRNLF
jgi:hypothetical protein